MSRMKKVLVVLAVLVVAIGAGAWLADHLLREKGHPGLRRFMHQVAMNYPKGFAVEPVVLKIQVKEQELAHLEKVVEEARARGVILPEGNEYVPAQVTGPDGMFKARIRIKGKLTDHVEGDKWSFRVIGKKDGTFLGMRRFSLQHPGTRNYLYDWFYHQLMKGEGIIALRYGFIRVEFNGEDLGIYAYEEHFGQELLANNERFAGPIFRFDPGLYWEHRLNEMHGLKLDDPYAEYQAAALDAFSSNAMRKDESMISAYEEAVALIEAFRRGRLSASQVFDADKIARRHAILDLIGGHHSMDFSDVKFYYDPVARKVEPVAYESFSAFRIRTLAGSNKFTGRQEEAQDLHEGYFNDPHLFRLYVAHLERISRPEYLDSAFTALASAMDTASATIYREFPWKELDRSIYDHNQKVIRRLLDVPKGFHAYTGARHGDTLEITAVPVEALPLEVHGLLVDGELLPPLGTSIVPCRMPQRMGIPVTLRFLVPRTEAGDRMLEARMVYSVLGASARKELDVFPYALLEPELAERLVPVNGSMDLPFIHVDEGSKELVLRSGSHVIREDLVLPAGYRVLGRSPLHLDLTEGARIISYSPMDLHGNEEDPVRITSADAKGGGLFILDARENSRWRHVEVGPMPGSGENGAAITFQNTRVRLVRCRIGGAATHAVLRAVRSDLRLEDVVLAGGRDQLHSTYSYIHAQRLDMYGAADDAMVLRGGLARLEDVSIENAKGSGAKVLANAEVEARSLRIANVDTGLELAEGAIVRIHGGSLDATEMHVEIDKVKMGHGAVHAELKDVRMAGAQERISVAEGNILSINGSGITTEVQTKQ